MSAPLSPRPAAHLVRCTDGVHRVRFRCRCCGHVNVTVYIAGGFDPSVDQGDGFLPGMAGDHLAVAKCLDCGHGNPLRIVGQWPVIWDQGSVWIPPRDGQGPGARRRRRGGPAAPGSAGGGS